jgi:hypothetical protein
VLRELVAVTETGTDLDKAARGSAIRPSGHQRDPVS